MTNPLRLFGVPLRGCSRYSSTGLAMRLVIDILRGEEAATAVEYAVMLMMILMAVLGSIGMVGEQAGGMWGGIEGDLADVGFID